MGIMGGIGWNRCRLDAIGDRDDDHEKLNHMDDTNQRLQTALSYPLGDFKNPTLNTRDITS